MRIGSQAVEVGRCHMDRSVGFARVSTRLCPFWERTDAAATHAVTAAPSLSAAAQRSAVLAGGATPAFACTLAGLIPAMRDLGTLESDSGPTEVHGSLVIRRLARVVVGLCLATATACTAESGSEPESRASAPSSASVPLSASPSGRSSNAATTVPLAGEPFAGVALVRKVAFATWTSTATDGSMLLAYDGPRRCYFRRVDRGGSVAGGFGPARDHGCPFLAGHASRHVGANGLPFKRTLDVSDPGRIVAISGEDPAGRPQAGDAYLGFCSDYMSEDDVGYATYSRVGAPTHPARALSTGCGRC